MGEKRALSKPEIRENFLHKIKIGREKSIANMKLNGGLEVFLENQEDRDIYYHYFYSTLY